MRGPRRRGQTAGASLNELSSEDDSGSSSSDYEPENSRDDQLPNANYASSDGPSDRTPNSTSNIMQPDTVSTSSSNSSDLQSRIAISDPEAGPSRPENQDERDLSQEEVDKLVQLQDLTGK